MTFNLADKMQMHSDAATEAARVAAFDAMVADWCKLVEQEQAPKPDLFADMKFSLDMDARVLTCTLNDKVCKLEIYSMDPYVFYSLTVGEIIAAAKAKLLDVLRGTDLLQ